MTAIAERPATALDREVLLRAYRTMRTIREFEDRAHREYATGAMPGFIHLYAGEEAIATGVCLHLRSDDRIASTHRGHGHCIAKGVDVRGMMAELYAKRTGTCKGKGGSMHIADLDRGMLGANGIVGGGPPLACGAALAALKKGTDGVAVAFVGDGGSNQGTTLESLNLASVWKLPVIFVVENNGYAETVASSHFVSGTYPQRAAGFGMPGVSVDGHDFFAVFEAAGESVRRARAGEGPSLIECTVGRYYGHQEGDTQTYRPKGEGRQLRKTRDCLARFAARVTAEGLLTPGDLAAIDAEVAELIDTAVREAIAAPEPEPADLLSDVYVSY